MTPAADRLHGLDALRAVALLLGVLLHSSLTYVVPPGAWAVGTREPTLFLGWLVYYLHSFRLEVFFLLAGFFGALVVERRGAAAYAWDRLRRILLVFLVALYPMKFVLSALWIAGGRETGWLQLPPVIASLPWYLLAFGSLALETSLTHLWFLYYLFWICVVFLVARWVVSRIAVRPRAIAATVDRAVEQAISSRVAPLLVAIAVTPVLAMMEGMDVDTPDRSFGWHLPVMALYGLFFSLGWWLHHHTDVVGAFARRWKICLLLGLVTSLVASALVGLRIAGGDWMTQHTAAMRWASSFGTSLTMAASVFGWTGAFVHLGARPSERVRYVADASYWIYIAHLPLVVALQVWWAHWTLPWWIQVPLLNVVTLAALLLLYHVGVRYTWVGAWLNGRRRTRGAPDDQRRRVPASSTTTSQ